MTDIIRPQEYLVPVDSDGNWSIEIPNNFSEGIHAIVAESDLTGQKDAGVFFIEQVKSSISGPLEAIESTVAQFPGWLAFAILLLLILILILASYTVKIGNHLNDIEEGIDDGLDKERLIKHKKHAHHAIFFSGLVVVTALVIAVTFGKQSGFYNEQYAEVDSVFETLQNTFIHQLAGRIETPFEHDPVSGVDVASAETSIKTQDSGQYVLFNVNSADGVDITHPELQRRFNLKVVNENTNIVFDIALYNTLSKILDRESYADLKSIYDFVYPDLAQIISYEEFQKDYESFFTAQDRTKQEIEVLEVHDVLTYNHSRMDQLIQRAVLMKVINNGKVKEYVFTKFNGNWVLLNW